MLDHEVQFSRPSIQVSRRPESYYFFMKSDRLSPRPEEALELCPDLWSSRACRPALRFLARFLLLALADSLAGSVVAAGRFSCDATFCWPIILLLPLALSGLGAGSCSLVYLLHLPQVKALDVLGFCEEEGAAAGAPWTLGCFLTLCLGDLSAPILSSEPWPRTMMCPQQLQTCCRWWSVTGTSWSTSSDVRLLIRKAEVSGEDVDSRWAASVKNCSCGPKSGDTILRSCEQVV